MREWSAIAIAACKYLEFLERVNIPDSGGREFYLREPSRRRRWILNCRQRWRIICWTKKSQLLKENVLVERWRGRREMERKKRSGDTGVKGAKSERDIIWLVAIETQISARGRTVPDFCEIRLPLGRPLLSSAWSFELRPTPNREYASQKRANVDK